MKCLHLRKLSGVWNMAIELREWPGFLWFEGESRDWTQDCFYKLICMQLGNIGNTNSGCLDWQGSKMKVSKIFKHTKNIYLK